MSDTRVGVDLVVAGELLTVVFGVGLGQLSLGFIVGAFGISPTC